MKLAVTFTVLGRPAPGGSKRVIPLKRDGVFTGKHVVTDAGVRNKPWRDSVAAMAQEAMSGHEPLTGPLALRLKFYVRRPSSHYTKVGQKVSRSAPRRPTVRPDLTKYIRAVEDACTSIVWRDDSQIVTQIAQKFYGTPERCELEVSELVFD